jgi:hypothetical protein
MLTRLTISEILEGLDNAYDAMRPLGRGDGYDSQGDAILAAGRILDSGQRAAKNQDTWVEFCFNLYRVMVKPNDNEADSIVPS